MGCNLRLQRSQNIRLVLCYIINVSKVTTTMKATSTPLSLSHRPLVDAGLCQIGSHTTLKPNVTFDNLTLLDYVAFKNGHLLPSSFFLFPDVLFSLQWSKLRSKTFSKQNQHPSLQRSTIFVLAAFCKAGFCLTFLFLSF